MTCGECPILEADIFRRSLRCPRSGNHVAEEDECEYDDFFTLTPTEVLHKVWEAEGYDDI